MRACHCLLSERPRCWKYCVLALYSLPPWRSQARPHLHIPELGRMRRTASHPVTDCPNRRQPQTTAILSSTTHVGLAVAATLIPTFAVFYRSMHHGIISTSALKRLHLLQLRLDLLDSFDKPDCRNHARTTLQ